jgi:hypothetical protein
MVMVSGKATGTAMTTVIGDGDCKPATASITLCRKSAENQQGELKKLLIVTIVIGQILQTYYSFLEYNLYICRNLVQGKKS